MEELLNNWSELQARRPDMRVAGNIIAFRNEELLILEQLQAAGVVDIPHEGFRVQELIEHRRNQLAQMRERLNNLRGPG